MIEYLGDSLKKYSAKNRIQAKLLFRIGLIALVTGLLFSSIQVYIDYQAQNHSLNDRIAEIIATSTNSAVHAAWNFDSEAAREVVLGLLEYDIVVKAEIRDDFDRAIAAVNKKTAPIKYYSAILFKGYSSAKADLYISEYGNVGDQKDSKIGTLNLTLNAETIAHSFVVRTGQIFFADLLRVILLVALLLSVFNLTLTLPLVQTGKLLRETDPESLGDITIPIPEKHETDELGMLVNDLNSLLASVQVNIKHRTQAEQELKDLNLALEQKVKDRTDELSGTLSDLQEAHQQLKVSQSTILQQDKMASIGQLAAGVAHEINNPMGFITSNLGALERYRVKLFDYIEQVESITVTAEQENQAIGQKICDIKKKMKIDLINEDIEDLLVESQDGAQRVTEIVQNLKGFSRVDQLEETAADINDCLEKTLNMAWNEIKYKATVEKKYGDLPLLVCYPQQLNQVFLNILVNAAHAIEDVGVIEITTKHVNDQILVTIADNGSGISDENISKLFEPFFTTKDVGKGTGLGLSIAYEIIKKHNGEITVTSTEGQGTTFTINLPIA